MLCLIPQMWSSAVLNFEFVELHASKHMAPISVTAAQFFELGLSTLRRRRGCIGSKRPAFAVLLWCNCNRGDYHLEITLSKCVARVTSIYYGCLLRLRYTHRIFSVPVFQEGTRETCGSRCGFLSSKFPICIRYVFVSFTDDFSIFSFINFWFSFRWVNEFSCHLKMIVRWWLTLLTATFMNLFLSTKMV